MDQDATPSRQRLLHGSRFDVYAVNLPSRTPGGAPHTREVVVHPGAVVVLPILGDEVVLIRNHRFSVGQTLWELPAGTLEPPEPPADCAARELIEETGYKAGLIQPMIDFYSSPGFCTELLYSFVATDLTHVGQALEDTEDILVEPVAYGRVLEMVQQRQIRDGKSIAALLYYNTFVRNAD